MREGLRAECLLASKIRAILLVFVRRAAYTTVKQKPVPKLKHQLCVLNIFRLKFITFCFICLYLTLSNSY